MKKKSLIVLLLFCLTIFANGCSTQNNAAEVDYDETKKMVVDILKTDDGKKALKEVLADEELKQELVMDNTVVADSIAKTLVSDKGKEFWKTSFEDPDFVKAYAESMKTENENLLKGLIKDPEYRTMLVEVLHDPELETELSDLLKSTDYRKHLQSVITETIESPLYQAKIQEILLKAASEQNKKEESKGGA
ncbi:spore germination lipoprotein GerD [Caldibacillus lycopersici]|uniref:Spore germination lipoprotein GerD n=1 Tax=Perspicuibacillus lycopersici TaxID=1325689 RepID=A0AAE3IYB5_9BACI|nr:spore germination lipoprotein GerD [Perspicuibacillus lycopersici]MCU9615179.1 spore germination lipoprotein GerD [Perspicuibacillus lycopersici]